MKYEATIHFEVKDENVDLTELIADQKIDIHGVGLVGRTDEGEVASEMQMMWGGEVDWRSEAKVKIAQATKEISRRLDVDEETANSLWEGMSGVYELMAAKGMSAFPGGVQSVNVIPEALEYIRRSAAALPEEGD
jgi:phytoene/squalene synthetase